MTFPERRVVQWHSTGFQLGPTLDWQNVKTLGMESQVVHGCRVQRTFMVDACCRSIFFWDRRRSESLVMRYKSTPRVSSRWQKKTLCFSLLMRRPCTYNARCDLPVGTFCQRAFFAKQVFICCSHISAVKAIAIAELLACATESQQLSICCKHDAVFKNGWLAGTWRCWVGVRSFGVSRAQPWG